MILSSSNIRSFVSGVNEMVPLFFSACCLKMVLQEIATVPLHSSRGLRVEILDKRCMGNSELGEHRILFD